MAYPPVLSDFSSSSLKWHLDKVLPGTPSSPPPPQLIVHWPSIYENVDSKVDSLCLLPTILRIIPNRPTDRATSLPPHLNLLMPRCHCASFIGQLIRPSTIDPPGSCPAPALSGQPGSDGKIWFWFEKKLSKMNKDILSPTLNDSFAWGLSLSRELGVH